MFKIQKYQQFNSASASEVKVLKADDALLAGLCTYRQANHSIFLMQEPMLSYVAVGHKYMMVNGVEFILNAGDLLYLPSSSIVFTYIPQQAAGFESINVVLPANLIYNKPQLLQTTDLRPVPEKGKLLKAIQALIQAHGFKKEPKVAGEKDLGTIINVLLQNMYKPLLLPQLASACHMSTSTFKRKFESGFGMSPKAWKRSICLQTAYFNLRTGNYKVSELLESIGFESFPHFSYAFKKQFSRSPSQVAGSRLS